MTFTSNIVCTWIIHSLFVTHCNAQITQQWIINAQKLRTKINQWNNQANNFNECISVGPRTTKFLDYPNGDDEKMKIVKSLWEDYYECLNGKNEVIRKHGFLPSYADAVFEFSTVRLDCNICMSPEDDSDDAEWFRFQSPSKFNTEVSVEEDDHIQISPFSNTLTIYSARSQHEGIYYCKNDADKDAPHVLHVLFPNNEPMVEVKPSSAKLGPYAGKPTRIGSTQLILFNDWSEWTDCGWCGSVSHRLRLGYCQIGLEKYLPKSLIMQTQNSPNNELINIDKDILAETKSLLEYFPVGIPCRSALFMKEILKINFINQYPNYVEVGYCKVACPSDIIVEVMNKLGSIIETYNNTAGNFFPGQILPDLPIGPASVNLYAKKNKPFVISCPSKVDKSVSVEWSVGGKIWLKETILQMSKERIYINAIDEIVFKKVGEVDVKKYSCYQKRELVGVVHLKLSSDPILIEEYTTLELLFPKVMIIALICVLIRMSIRMFLNRPKARTAEQPSKRINFKYSQLLQQRI